MLHNFRVLYKGFNYENKNYENTKWAKWKYKVNSKDDEKLTCVLQGICCVEIHVEVFLWNVFLGLQSLLIITFGLMELASVWQFTALYNKWVFYYPCLSYPTVLFREATIYC